MEFIKLFIEIKKIQPRKNTKKHENKTKNFLSFSVFSWLKIKMFITETLVIIKKMQNEKVVRK